MPNEKLSAATLATYSLDVHPDPLEVSPELGNIVYGAITFVISNNTGETIRMSELTFTLPPGPDGSDLSDDPSAILYASSPDRQWKIAMTSEGVFTALPASGSSVRLDKGGMVFQFFNIPINQEMGTVIVAIRETAVTDTKPSQARETQLSVAKFPYGFFFGNFTAQVPMVEKGARVTLTWEASDQATYRMFWDTNAAGEDVTELRTWMSKELSSDTSFLLRASVEHLGETITKDLSTTVIVNNPDIKATYLTVKELASLEGIVIVGGDLTAKKDLMVTGKTTLGVGASPGDLLVHGMTRMDKELTASGGIVASTLYVRENSILSHTAVNGLLTTGHAVGMMGKPVPVSKGTFKAFTDGLVICKVNSAPDTNRRSCARGYGYTSDLNVCATGGNVEFVDKMNGNSPNGFTMAVRKDQDWFLATQYFPDDGSTPAVEFYWVPFGNISPSYAQLSNEPLRPIPGELEMDTRERPYTQFIERLVDILEGLGERAMEPGKKEELQGLIRALVYGRM